MDNLLPYPVYAETENTLLQFTVDGRVGAVFYFNDLFSAAKFFIDASTALPFVHVQLNDLRKVYTVAVSLFVKSPPPSRLKSLFFDVGPLKQNFNEISEAILGLSSALPRGYPDISSLLNDYNRRHVYKLKRSIMISTLFDDLDEIYEKGICLIKTPTDSVVHVLYYTLTTLESMIKRRLFCAEYNGDFKYRALYLWLPLAANFYLVELFKL